MTEEKGPAPFWRSVLDLLQHWQVVVTVVAATLAIWYKAGEERRKELDVNRVAVETARKPETRAQFIADPHNTLVEFQATYPQHAYCAALGFFVAEAGRETRQRLDRSDTAVKEVNDALAAAVEDLADRAGIAADAFESFVQSATASADPPEGPPRCAQVRADVPLAASYTVKEECLLAIHGFGQNRCLAQRWVNERAREVAAEQAEVQAETAVAEPVDLPPDVGIDAPVIIPAPGLPGPGPACGAIPPLVFVHFTSGSDRSTVEALRTEMLAAGWKVTAADHVPDSNTSGDLRIYWDAQRPCAEELAGILSDLPEIDRPIRIISLEGRYRGLPQGQMELWLPVLSPG
jgi:hypothetical protein